jgi:HlyD family type I secretion membrane fusion protein
MTANPDLRISSPRGWIVAGLVVVLMAFGGLGTWATLVPLSGAVIAPGVVTVLSNRKTVQHLEGGIVTEILVRDGDVVETGQLLIQLDGTRAQASVSILEGEIDLLRSREARLLAERDGTTEIAFPPALAARAREDANVAELVRGQQLLFEARRASLDGESELLAQRVGQYEDEIAGLQQQSLSKDRQIEIVEDELEGLHALYERGFESRRRINELERLAEELRGELGAHTMAIARAENSIAEANLRIVQLRKEFREQVVKELDDVQARFFDVSERQVAASDRMTRLEIRAPQSGIVVGMRAHTVGGVIGPGEPVLDIVPAGDELVIEAHDSAARRDGDRRLRRSGGGRDHRRGLLRRPHWHLPGGAGETRGPSARAGHARGDVRADGLAHGAQLSAQAPERRRRSRAARGIEAELRLPPLSSGSPAHDRQRIGTAR